MLLVLLTLILLVLVPLLSLLRWKIPRSLLLILLPREEEEEAEEGVGTVVPVQKGQRQQPMRL